MNKTLDKITELNQSYNDLGEDLLILEAVILATQEENAFPQEYVKSSLERMAACIEQHTGDIQFLAERLRKEAAPAPRLRRSSRRPPVGPVGSRRSPAHVGRHYRQKQTR